MQNHAWMCERRLGAAFIEGREDGRKPSGSVPRGRALGDLHTTERHCLGHRGSFPRPSFNQFELFCPPCPLSAWVPVGSETRSNERSPESSGCRIRTERRGGSGARRVFPDSGLCRASLVSAALGATAGACFSWVPWDELLCSWSLALGPGRAACANRERESEYTTSAVPSGLQLRVVTLSRRSPKRASAGVEDSPAKADGTRCRAPQKPTRPPSRPAWVGVGAAGNKPLFPREWRTTCRRHRERWGGRVDGSVTSLPLSATAWPLENCGILLRDPAEASSFLRLVLGFISWRDHSAKLRKTHADSFVPWKGGEGGAP
jgi:hypothetical protein